MRPGPGVVTDEALIADFRARSGTVYHPSCTCRMGRDALGKLVPLRPYPDGDKSIMACPRCGSGEYLHNEDGNEQNFCGQCGQAIEWR